MSSNTHLPDRVLACLEQHPHCKSIVVAYSGGVDSHVLLHAVHAVFAAKNTDVLLRAVHVNHQLQAESPEWQRHCQSVCGALGIPFVSVSVDAHPGAGESPEAAARDARYQALSDLIEENELLLTAHHQDDQAETVLLQLFRGAGSAGLSAMPNSRSLGCGVHARPFIDTPKQLLLNYAEVHQLNFVDDPSNRSDQFQRNFLRNSIMPAIQSRWPAASETIARSARHSAEFQQLAEKLAEIDAVEVIDEHQRLDLSLLPMLPLLRQSNLLRYWLRSLTGAYPSTQQLSDIHTSVIAARIDAEPQLSIGNFTVRRFRDYLYLTRNENGLPKNWCQQWQDISQPLELPELNTRIPTSLLPQEIGSNAHVFVRLRRGGESIRQKGRPRKSLKSVLQEHGVPPWMRDQLPLVFVNDELVAVHGLLEIK